MKKFQDLFLKTTQSYLKRDANCTSSLFLFQPKAPANLKKFKK